MERDSLHDECGVFGIYGHGNVAEIDLLRPLRPPAPRPGRGRDRRAQRREDAGPPGLGLVSDVFPETIRAQIDGYMGIGHNRYATTGKATKLRNVQPILVDYKGGKLAIAHNGNLTNVGRAAQQDGAGRLASSRPRPTRRSSCT